MSVTGSRVHAVPDGQPGELIPAIGYIRVSMAREEMISPEIQESAIKASAERDGRRIIEWIADLDQTGRNFKRKVQTGISKIEQGPAKELRVYRYDRWGRNAAESLANVQRVEMAGGSVVSATEPLDPETAIGRYNRTNAFALAELQSDIIGDNWRAVMAHRVADQLPASGTPRFGYQRLGRIPDPFHNPSSRTRRRYRPDPEDPNERYVPDPETAPALEKMYDQYIAGWGYRRIAIWLNDRGIPNARGGAWSDVTVRNVLDAGFGAGYMQVHASQCKCRQRSSCKNRVRVRGKQQPVIGDEKWQAYLAARQDRAGVPSRTLGNVFPLRGLVFCGHCGSSMYIQSARGVPGYMYRCKRWHHSKDCDGPFPLRSVVEAAVRDKIAEWTEITEAKAVAKVRDTSRATAEAEQARAERELASTDAALRRLAVRKAVDGDRMPDEVYEGARDELLTRRGEWEERVRQAKGQAHANAAEFLPIAYSVLTEWDVLAPGQLQRLLSTIIRRVEVRRPARSPGRSLQRLPGRPTVPLKSFKQLVAQPGDAAPDLRAIRLQAGLTGYDLAGANGWAQSKVSRIETGKQLPTPADVEVWVHSCEQMAGRQPAAPYEIEVIPVWEAPGPA